MCVRCPSTLHLVAHAARLCNHPTLHLVLGTQGKIKSSFSRAYSLPKLVGAWPYCGSSSMRTVETGLESPLPQSRRTRSVFFASTGQVGMDCVTTLPTRSFLLTFCPLPPTHQNVVSTGFLALNNLNARASRTEKINKISRSFFQPTVDRWITLVTRRNVGKTSP